MPDIRVHPKYIHDYKRRPYQHGIASITLRYIPIYGTVRIILTAGCTTTHARDDIREFNIEDIKNDPSLLVILERI